MLNPVPHAQRDSPPLRLPSASAGVLALVLAHLLLGLVLGFFSVNEPMMLTTISICFVTNALGAIWAMLGLGSTWLRGVICLMISVLVGRLMPVVINGGDVVFWVSVVVLQTLYVICSLSVVRSLGYRLLRTAGSPGTSEP